MKVLLISALALLALAFVPQMSATCAGVGVTVCAATGGASVCTPSTCFVGVGYTGLRVCDSPTTCVLKEHDPVECLLFNPLINLDCLSNVNLVQVCLLGDSSNPPPCSVRVDVSTDGVCVTLGAGAPTCVP